MVRRMERAKARHGGTLPANDPIRLQSIPRAGELTTRSAELPDPLGEESFSPLPRLIHRYRDRALLLVTDECALHCRHCFRSRFTGRGRGVLSDDKLHAVADYLRAHNEVSEVLLSGGDALLLSDARLQFIMDTLREARPGLLFRVATRAPVTLPSRITSNLVSLLRSRSPVWIATQVNHPDELDEETVVALGDLVDAGIPVINQTVLLARINDDPEVLELLFRALVALRVKPYYLFQGDLAPGTGHFRVNLERSLAIVKALRARLSGVAMPVFAVDIPGGGGKVPLEPSAFDGEDAEGYRLIGPDGQTYHYPREEP
jgi:lysine 2,3-aminomutase